MQQRASVGRRAVDEGPRGTSRAESSKVAGKSSMHKAPPIEETGSKTKGFQSRLPHTQETEMSPEYGTGTQASAEMVI